MSQELTAGLLQLGDYVDAPVPMTERKSAVHVLFVFLGFIIVVGIMTVGGGLAAQLSFRTLIAVTLVGNILLGGFAAVSGWIGASSGKSFNLLLCDAFADQSWRLASLYVPVVLIAWYAVEAAIFGHLVAQSLGVDSPMAERGIIFASGLLFSTTAYIGFRAIRYVSLALVPILIAAGVYALLGVSFSEEARAGFGFGDTQLTIQAGLALVIGTWVMGSLTAVQDLTRFCRTATAGAMVGFFGIVIGNTFTLLVGAVGAAFTGKSDPAMILITLGLVWVALLFGIANIWTTNDNNMYSASLHIARVGRMKRPTAVLLCAVLGATFAVFEPYKLGFLFGFLNFLGGTAPALGAVVLADYWRRNRGMPEASTSIPAWLGWTFGSGVGLVVGGLLAPFAGLATSFALFWLLSEHSTH